MDTNKCARTILIVEKKKTNRKLFVLMEPLGSI